MEDILSSNFYLRSTFRNHYFITTKVNKNKNKYSFFTLIFKNIKYIVRIQLFGKKISFIYDMRRFCVILIWNYQNYIKILLALAPYNISYYAQIFSNISKKQ